VVIGRKISRDGWIGLYEIKDIEEVSEDLINHAEKIIKWIQERI